jgi:hypothetical protein
MGRFVEANTRKEVCMRLRRCIYDRKKILLYEIEETIFVPRKHMKKKKKYGKIYQTY